MGKLREADPNKQGVYMVYLHALDHEFLSFDFPLGVLISNQFNEGVREEKELMKKSLEIYEAIYGNEKLRERAGQNTLLSLIDTCREITLSYGDPHRPRLWSPDEAAERSKERGKKRREKHIYGYD